MPRGVADCRRYIYFRFPEELDQALLDQCKAWIEEHRSGKRILGYCTLYRRPITYYRGPCRGFKPYSLTPAKPLTYFLASG